MRALKFIWNKFTNTDALRLASGELEILFFEFVYRIIYLTGHSVYDTGVPYMIYSISVKTLLILLVIGELWQFFISTWTIATITSSVNIIFIQFGSYYKYKTMVNNLDVFKNLASSMESENFDLSTKERRKILKVWQKRNDVSLKLLLGLGTCTVIAWHIFPLVDDLEYNLMVGIKLPYNYESSMLYTFTYIGTLIVFSYISYSVMANDLIMQAHLVHLICQFAVLSDCFRNILTDCKLKLKVTAAVDPTKLHLNKNFQREYIKRLGKLVDQHNFILQNTLRLRDIMSAPLLIQVAISTTLICSIGFQVATTASHNKTKWLMTLLYLGYNMYVQYIICRWCEEIKTQSQGVGEAVYCSGWEGGIVTVPGVRTSVLLIVARANRPIALSAGGMYDLSLEAYASVLKTSYSALTVLLRLR